MGLGDDDEDSVRSGFIGGRKMAAFRIPYLIVRRHDNSKTDKNGSKRRNLLLKDCDEDKLVSYLHQLQEINPDNVVKLAKLEDITAGCK
jgi:hypothetical protein